MPSWEYINKQRLFNETLYTLLISVEVNGNLRERRIEKSFIGPDENYDVDFLEVHALWQIEQVINEPEPEIADKE